MTSIQPLERYNDTYVAQDLVRLGHGAAFSFDVEVDVDKVNCKVQGDQIGLIIRIAVVPRESYEDSKDKHVISRGEVSDQAKGVAGVDEIMDFLLDSSCTGCEYVQPIQSILKAPRSLLLREEEKSSEDRAVEFKKVVIREFGMTIGDHPNSVSGPPVRIDWAEEKEERHMDLEEYEQRRLPRRNRRELKLSLSDRHRILVEEKGHSFNEVKGAWKEALEIRAQRKETLSQTPMENKWDEIYESICRKYARLVSCALFSCV